MKWYEEKFVSHRDWILDHFDLLGLDPCEYVLVNMIDFLNQHHITITLEELSHRTRLDQKQLDAAISSLCSRRYLKIVAVGRNISFDLSGLFEADTARAERIMDREVYALFEKEFGRPLSQMELAKVNEWNRTTDRKMIIYALREASAYRNLSISYIDGILRAWKSKGITAAMIENGELYEKR